MHNLSQAPKRTSILPPSPKFKFSKLSSEDQNLLRETLAEIRRKRSLAVPDGGREDRLLSLYPHKVSSVADHFGNRIFFPVGGMPKKLIPLAIQEGEFE